MSQNNLKDNKLISPLEPSSKCSSFSPSSDAWSLKVAGGNPNAGSSGGVEMGVAGARRAGCRCGTVVRCAGRGTGAAGKAPLRGTCGARKGADATGLAVCTMARLPVQGDSRCERREEAVAARPAAMANCWRQAAMGIC